MTLSVISLNKKCQEILKNRVEMNKLNPICVVIILITEYCFLKLTETITHIAVSKWTSR